MTTFHQFLAERIEHGGFTTEDALAAFLPLVRQVVAAHEAGLCAPLEGIAALKVDDGQIGFDEPDRQPPRNNLSRVRKLLRSDAKSVEVVQRATVVRHLDDGRDEVGSKAEATHAGELERPTWLRGYVCWEHLVEHHDPLTDVYSLGLILASLACSLDLADPDDLQRFVARRSNLFDLTPGLHPVLAKAIRTMTELDRQKRPQDLPALLKLLENYRDHEVDFETDLASERGFGSEGPAAKRRIILEKLQERLFEVNRRNRLLDFKSTLQSVNLTQASIPLVFDYKNVREEQLVTWNGRFSRDVLSGRAVSLNKYLNFREAVYLPGTLDRIRAECARDEREYGFAQLRLVICFLRWANLKDKPPGRYESPLLLLPVRLVGEKRNSRPLRAHGTRNAGGGQSRRAAPVQAVVQHRSADGDRADSRGDRRVSRRPQRENPGRRSLGHAGESRQAPHRPDPGKSPAATRSVPPADPPLRPRHSVVSATSTTATTRPTTTRLACGSSISSCDQPKRTSNRSSRPARRRRNIWCQPRDEKSDVPPPKPAPAASSRTKQKDEPPVAEAERQFYQLRKEGDDNPFNWEFDLCSVTLANLRYRRMSLVRDYGELADQTAENPAFEATFAVAPREIRTDAGETLPLAERYNVVPCDPTQTQAIALARSGASYIIQGPPGTGKSQTITNLIADFVVRGQRVLFVCEKRAAIDVVYHRLKQRGLNELCCLIHDSQADKKEFVMDLKATYEAHLADATKRRDHAAGRRGRIVDQFQSDLAPLETFDAAMRGVPETCAVPLRSALDRRVRLAEHAPNLSPLEWERIPFYADWHHHQAPLTELAESLGDVQSDGILAHHPLHLLSGKVADAERPLELVSRCLGESRSKLTQLRTKLRGLDLPAGSINSLDDLAAAVAYARQAAFLARANAMAILNAESDAAKRWQSETRNVRQCEQDIAKKREATQAWREKLSPGDTETALAQAGQFAGKFFAFLSPAWWRLRGVLNRAYDFHFHKVHPSWVRILEQLRDEHQAVARRAELAHSICHSFGLEGDFDRVEAELAALQTTVDKLPDSLRPLHAAAASGGDATILAIAALADDLHRLETNCDDFLEAYRHCGLAELETDLGEMEDSLDELPDYLHCLAQLSGIPPKLAESIRTFPISLDAMEAATAERSLQLAWRDRTVGRFDGTAQRRQVSRLRRLADEWQKQNAKRVREFVRQRFLDNAQAFAKPAAQLTPQQKEIKHTYNRGRRELEHEFGKTMRYKSIRDLMAGDSGTVIRDLKPVWLMSPLSVSDTLPLDADHFDVVIFDEASQITLEEAVPSIFRARQAIVVGDEMQLPPTSFLRVATCRRRERADVRGGRRAGDIRRRRQQLFESGRPQPARLHARLALPQPIGIADQFLESRLLRRPAAHRARRAPAREGRPGTQRRVGRRCRAKTPTSCSIARSASTSSSRASTKIAATPRKPPTSPASCGEFSSAKRDKASASSPFPRPSRPRSKPPSRPWPKRMPNSPAASSWNRNAKRTSSSWACWSRTWRTSRGTSGT